MTVIKALARALAATLLALVALTASLLVDGLNDNPQASDVGIVLGSMVMPNGKPSPRLQARLDRAAELYRLGLFPHLIVSGGTGPEGPNEAVVMASYLANTQHLPREALIVDASGNTTQATARNSAALMQQHGWHSAVVITQYFHITRSRYALHQAGVTTVYTAHARYFEARDLYAIARETVALPMYWAGLR